MSYRIREVDGGEQELELHELHDLSFGNDAPWVDTTYGYWWIVYHEKEPVGFAGLVPSELGDDIGYLKRAGVLYDHRGRGLQLKLIRVRERRARRLGWHALVTDTTYDNIASANNLIRAGFRLFEPAVRWSFSSGLYWRKELHERTRTHIGPSEGHSGDQDGPARHQPEYRLQDCGHYLYLPQAPYDLRP